MNKKQYLAVINCAPIVSVILSCCLDETLRTIRDDIARDIDMDPELSEEQRTNGYAIVEIIDAYRKKEES